MNHGDRPEKVMTGRMFALVLLCAGQGCTPEVAQGPEESTQGTAIAQEIVVSTNEPFWQARVEGATVVLSGAGVDERRLAIRASALETGARVVRAGDAAGELELRVTDAECQDSMSGAVFPLSGTLVIDGGDPIHGCARPASMPPPRPPEEGGGDDTAIP